MENQLSKHARQRWIILNYFSILLIIGFFYLSLYFRKPALFFTGGAVGLVLVVVSYARVFFKTNLWKMVYKEKEYLDERQVQVFLQAMRQAYVVFVIVAIVLIYGFSVIGESIHVVIGACLLYLAHTLPAAIVGWKEEFL